MFFTQSWPHLCSISSTPWMLKVPRTVMLGFHELYKEPTLLGSRCHPHVYHKPISPEGELWSRAERKQPFSQSLHPPTYSLGTPPTSNGYLTTFRAGKETTGFDSGHRQRQLQRRYIYIYTYPQLSPSGGPSEILHRLERVAVLNFL